MIMLIRFWREGVIASLVLALGLALLAKAGEARRADKWQARARAEIAAHRQTETNHRLAAERARAEDAAHARRVERDQTKLSEEVSNDYQSKLAALRSRYDALRLRLGTPPADPGAPGGAPVPRLPDTPGRPDAASPEARLPPEDALIASEQALQLQALIEWVRGQAGVKR